MATKLKENRENAQQEHFDQAQHKHFDVLIIGAGISGIGAACHLKRELPGKSYAILERRQAVGGTWDLFRYPGIRSDSDMNTFGFGFRPWAETRVLSDGPAIKQYVEDTAKEYDVMRHIRFGTKVTGAKFSTHSFQVPDKFSAKRRCRNLTPRRRVVRALSGCSVN